MFKNSNMVVLVTFKLCVRNIISGLVVTVLPIGPKVRGFKSDRGQWIFKSDKIRNTPSFVGDVKPSALCLKALRHVKKHFEV
jgi:hypothetical protein